MDAQSQSSTGDIKLRDMKQIPVFHQLSMPGPDSPAVHN